MGCTSKDETNDIFWRCSCLNKISQRGWCKQSNNIQQYPTTLSNSTVIIFSSQTIIICPYICGQGFFFKKDSSLPRCSDLTYHQIENVSLHHDIIIISSSNRTAIETVCFGMARSATPSAPHIITGQSQEPDREFLEGNQNI